MTAYECGWCAAVDGSGGLYLDFVLTEAAAADWSAGFDAACLEYAPPSAGDKYRVWLALRHASKPYDVLAKLAKES